MSNQGEYPTNGELKKIRNWPATDFHGLMEYIYERWNYADCGYWTQEGDVYHISTGGWSGNEDIVGAMMRNVVWWMMYWKSSKRGGHYIFCPIGTEAE
jgi:hypothetical protein